MDHNLLCLAAYIERKKIVLYRKAQIEGVKLWKTLFKLLLSRRGPSTLGGGDNFKAATAATAAAVADNHTASQC